jgi:hypothetical protein
VSRIGVHDAISINVTAHGLKQAIAERIHPAAARPTDADVTSVIRGLDNLSPKPWPVRFKEWQARNGEIEITKARVQQNDVIAEGAGTLRLRPRGGLDGSLQVTIIGIEQMFRMFNLERLISEGQMGCLIS